MSGIAIVEEKALCEAFHDDPRWVALTKITASAAFVRAPRLCQLLEYLATQTLLDRADQVTEFELAFEVFDRDQDFNPAADTIVRSHLARLRQRLLQADLGDAKWIPSIPKGQYGLVFQEVILPLAETPEPRFIAPEPQVPHTPAQTVPQRIALYKILSVVLALLLVLAAIALLHHSALVDPSPVAIGASDPLWDRFFVPGQTMTLVAADSSLVLMHHYLHHDISLADYISGRYRQKAEDLYHSGVEPSGLIDRRYSSMADLEVTRLLAEISGAKHMPMRASFARDVTMDDLKQNNVVLSGSKGANPWLELYEPQMNFLIENDYPRNLTVVRNRHPRDDEPKEYNGDIPHVPVTYGVLAFLPGIEPSRNVLILEGTSVAGTESIYDLLSDKKELNRIIEKFKNSDGSLKHFEVLLASESVDGSAAKFHVVAFRAYS
jgi:hypothetical protein